MVSADSLNVYVLDQVKKLFQFCAEILLHHQVHQEIQKSTLSLEWEKPEKEGGSKLLGYFTKMRKVRLPNIWKIRDKRIKLFLFRVINGGFDAILPQFVSPIIH